MGLLGWKTNPSARKLAADGLAWQNTHTVGAAVALYLAVQDKCPGHRLGLRESAEALFLLWYEHYIISAHISQDSYVY